MKIQVYVQLEDTEEQQIIENEQTKGDFSYLIDEILEKTYSGEATIHLIREITSR